MDSTLKDYVSIEKFEAIPQEEYEGEQTNIDTIINKEIAIMKFKVLPSSFYEGNYLLVQVMDKSNELAWFRTGSAVLEKQLTQLEKQGKLPIRATIRKVKRYYTLS